MVSNVNLIDHYKAVRARMGMGVRRPVAVLPPRVQPSVERPAQMSTTRQSALGNQKPPLQPWSQPRPLWATHRSGVPVFVVQCMVADYYGISRDEMISKRRKAKIILPRHVCIYLCRKLSNRSYPEISTQFRRHHTTIINAVHRIERLILKREDVATAVNRLTFLLTGEQPFVYWGA